MSRKIQPYALAHTGAQAVRTRRRSARFETKKGLTGYVQFTAWHTTASTFLYEIVTNRSTLLGAERLQATLAGCCVPGGFMPAGFCPRRVPTGFLYTF
jgi:hypothetical protein